jgi:catechol 2,3-dioxygenase-like lactoylglutathione lyase family enzyme
MTCLLTALDHVQLALPAGEEAKARAFYEGVLGLSELTKPEPLQARGGCWFERGSVAVHLGVEAEFRPARKAHPAFVVSDLDALATNLTQAGYDAIWDESLLPIIRRFYAFDPFGNRLEFLTQQLKKAT